jgi:hypothetical protein
MTEARRNVPMIWLPLAAAALMWASKATKFMSRTSAGLLGMSGRDPFTVYCTDVALYEVAGALYTTQINDINKTKPPKTLIKNLIIKIGKK